MPRQFTSATSLENLRKETKRWLRALRAGDTGARARLDRAWPQAPREPVLRDVQHALAREYGQENWIALKRSIDSRSEGADPLVERPLLGMDAYEALAQDYVPGFRHVGRCARLERLTCMYCRESGDEATGHIAGLKIRYYYAGLTQITDRSLVILGGMRSLEQVELYECRGVTDAGLPFIAALPQLREVALEGLPGVTFAGTKVFPAGVRVRYST